MDFDFEKLSQSDQVKAMICRTTLIGVVNTGYNLCQSLRWYYKDANNDSKKILTGLSSWYANELVESENKLIMGFNMWAEKNQHLWKEFYLSHEHLIDKFLTDAKIGFETWNTK